MVLFIAGAQQLDNAPINIKPRRGHPRLLAVPFHLATGGSIRLDREIRRSRDPHETRELTETTFSD